MIKVLAVDDEQPVLDGIARIIARHFPGLELAATARSGRLAIERALEARPDIVLMDVNLPGISGLDAIREIKNGLPESIFILVTAYERFDIARQAFELGVSDYLLKPVNKERLLAVLEKAQRTLEKRGERHTGALERLELFEECQGLLEPQFFRDAARAGGLPELDHAARMAAYGRVFGLPAEGGRMAVAAAPGLGQRVGRVRNNLQYRLRGLAAADGPDRCRLFFPLPQAAEVEAIQAAIAEAAGDCRVGVGEIASLEQLDRSLAEAAAGLAVGSENAGAGSWPWEAERALVESLLHKGAADFMANLADWCRNQAGCPERLAEGVLALFHCVGHRAPDIAGQIGPPDFDDADSPGALGESCLAWGNRLCLAWDGRRQSVRSPVVSRALAFIDSQWRNQISLEDAADAAGVSPPYLSRLFSEEMRESFIEHLTRVRMNHARDMLRQGLPVKAVTKELGYTDPNYFSRLFKKQTGLTPSEFARD